MDSHPRNPYKPPLGPTNFLPDEIDYRIEKTSMGTWQSFMYEDGKTYYEFTSHTHIANVPLLHYTSGKCPETGRIKTARGIIAVGRRAIGMFAFGQLAIGLFAFGQAAFGAAFGLGQFAMGTFAIGQGAIAIVFALGQFAAAYDAIGMFAAGYYAQGMFAAGVEATGKYVYQIVPFW